MSDAAGEPVADRVKRILQDPLDLIEFWVRDIYRPLANPGTPPSFVRDGFRLPAPNDLMGYVAEQEWYEKLRQVVGEARARQMTEDEVWQGLDKTYRELLRGSFIDLQLELNGYHSESSSGEARRLLGVAGRLEALITAYHPGIPQVWDDLRAGVIGLRQTRLYPPAADSTPEPSDNSNSQTSSVRTGKRKQNVRGSVRANEKMLKALKEDPELRSLTAAQWAKRLRCAASTVKETQCWVTYIQGLRQDDRDGSAVKQEQERQQKAKRPGRRTA